MAARPHSTGRITQPAAAEQTPKSPRRRNATDLENHVKQPGRADLVKQVRAKFCPGLVARSSLFKNKVPATAQLIRRLSFSFIVPPENLIMSGSLN